MSILLVPKPGPLFVDKLSMTLDVPESNKKTVVKNFIEVIGEFYGGKLWESTTYHCNKNVYVDGEYILFQCGPKGNKMNLFRVAYNPSKIDPSEVAKIANLVLPGGYEELIEYGRITRIDIAVDCKYLPVRNLFFQYPGLAVSKNHLKSGSIQTAYLGGDESPNQFVLYDKVAEIKHNNSKHGNQVKVAVPSCSMTRIEWRYRPKEICTFKTLLSTGNNFENLSLGMMGNQPKMPSNDLEGFIKLVFELSKYHGLQQALFNVPKSRRKEVMEAIVKLCKTSWWKPAELWQTLPAALEPIINPVMPYGYPEKVNKSNET